jgi:hypothetical protein
MYGLGNWLEVAEHVGTKSKLQCIDHYTTAYMNSPCYPLPVTIFLYPFINPISELTFLNLILPHGCRICLMLMARTGRSF